MKKIPTLFVRTFENHKVKSITNEITPGCEEAFYHGTPTIKHDGSCCAVIDGVFYKRFDAKKGRKIPDGAIPCCDPDPITGHWPHWVKVDPERPEDKWFIAAYNNSGDLAGHSPYTGTYEAVGPHFQNNPYELSEDGLYRHGLAFILDLPRTFDGIKEFLENHYIEGIVFWHNGEPVCKIKRSDFGLPWNNKK